MKIALVAPLQEAVPPRLYGGTERVVAWLADALVDLGHEVTLFASAESKTKANLVVCRDQALRLDPASLKSDVAAHMLMLKEVARRADDFDILHCHVDLLPCAFFREHAQRTLTTVHGRLDIKDLSGFYQQWREFPLVAISQSQQQQLPDANWAGTVYHGLPPKDLPFVENATGDYLLFLGRISPEKRPDLAIAVARQAGMPIKIAAKIDSFDAHYFHARIEPLLRDPQVEFLGEVSDADKYRLMGNAAALLFPVDWPEPFGLVMIESMACGTPVIAWPKGSVTEVVEAERTGFIVDSVEAAVAAVARLGELDRRQVRERFEQRFAARVMAEAYLALYRKQLDASQTDSGQSQEANVTPETQGSQETNITQEEGVALDVAPDAAPTTVESDEARMPYKLFALKHADTFLVADSFGDVAGRGDGLFRNDTRVLSEFRVVLGDRPLSLLSARVSQDNVFFTANVTNRPLPPLGGRSIPEGVIHIERSRFLWEERLFERLKVVNYGDELVKTPLRIYFGADFRDMFEVRGSRRKQRGTMLAPDLQAQAVVLGYRGLDAELRRSVVAFSSVPVKLTTGCAEFPLELACKHSVELYIEVGAEPTELPSRARFRQAAAAARCSMRGKSRSGGSLRSTERVFGHWLEKSQADLALLTTKLPTGLYPYAGIPWFSTTFGRDGIITALEMLWYDPAVARGVLAFLARMQATEVSRFQDAAPGKIMHEARKGEMTALKELPFGQYYGGVDSTPLFIMLAGAYAERTGDFAFIEQIWDALVAALGWIDQFGDSDGDGFLDYARAEASGLSNQGWKDSEDSVFHADGRFPQGPIALVEVQGYKYAALEAMASLALRRGDEENATRWQQQAKVVRAAVEQRFWMEDKAFYGLAIDGRGELCRVRASNAGHLLYTGLAAPERGASVARQLLSSDFDSGYGVRTLASDEIRYNPMSYHNGSIWPHDTALCAAGLARYGEQEGAAHILAELFEASVTFGMRLPELFCGFQRRPGEAPVAYPVACLPQAWSSGAVFMMLQACLGIRIDGAKREVQVRYPHLPPGLNQVAVRGLQIGTGRINLVFQRVRNRVVVFSEGGQAADVRVMAQV